MNNPFSSTNNPQRDFGGVPYEQPQHEEFIPVYTEETVSPTMTIKNLLVPELRDRAFRNQWTQSKLNTQIDKTNAKGIEGLKVMDRLCERCDGELTPRNIKRLPDGTYCHFYDCGP